MKYAILGCLFLALANIQLVFGCSSDADCARDECCRPNLIRSRSCKKIPQSGSACEKRECPCATGLVCVPHESGNWNPFRSSTGNCQAPLAVDVTDPREWESVQPGRFRRSAVYVDYEEPPFAGDDENGRNQLDDRKDSDDEGASLNNGNNEGDLSYEELQRQYDNANEADSDQVPQHINNDFNKLYYE